jgi:hypothetical protein
MESQMDKHLKIGLMVCAASLMLGGVLPLVTSPAVQTEAQAKYERVPLSQTSLAWEYSTEPPQVWLDSCVAHAQSENLKNQIKVDELNLKYPHLPPLIDPYLPPRTTCRDIWQNWEVQQQWHIDPVYGKNNPVQTEIVKGLNGPGVGSLNYRRCIISGKTYGYCSKVEAGLLQPQFNPIQKWLGACISFHQHINSRLQELGERVSPPELTCRNMLPK